MRKTLMHKSQNDLLAEHLKSGLSISGVEAQALYKVRSLTRRITDLKKRGMKIESVWRKDKLGQRYKRYYLKTG